MGKKDLGMMLMVLFFGVLLTGLMAELFKKKLEKFSHFLISFSVSNKLTVPIIFVKNVFLLSL